MTQTYHVYLSQAWYYKNARSRIMGLLDGQEYFTFVYHTLPFDDPVNVNGTSLELHEAISRYMEPCHLLLAMASPDDTYEKWTRKEMYIARGKLAIPAVMVLPWEKHNLTRREWDSYDTVVGWNVRPLISAVSAHCAVAAAPKPLDPKGPVRF